MKNKRMYLEREAVPDVCQEIGEGSVLKLHLLEYLSAMQEVMTASGRVATRINKDESSFIEPMLEYTERMTAIVQTFQKDMARLVFDITEKVAGINPEGSLEDYPDFVDFVNEVEDYGL